ncbi:MAG TPA: circadian clock KaiB family protein [Thermoanaerobaculia bacterium]|nr:circadian clock KaiB family protein [Thermoanaerobaculia bacterium]
MSPETYRFRLYVAGEAPNSLLAIANLTELCETHLPGRHQIEIIDVVADPKRALAESIFLTPMLVSVAPYPSRRIVGTLTNTEPILQILGLGSAQRRHFAGMKDRDNAPQLRQMP